MTGPKTLQLIKLADDLANKMEGTIVPDNRRETLNQQFEKQREFARKTYNKARNIHAELLGDIFTLKHRNFNPDMLKLAIKVKEDLEKLFRSYKESSPHTFGQKIVSFALDRPNGPIIDNLDFLTKHHIQSTQVQGDLPAFAKHAEVNSFKHLKELALETKAYMDQNPPIPVPMVSSYPPEPNPAADPSFLTDPEAATAVGRKV